MLKTKILDHSIQHKVIELVNLWDTRIADYKLSKRKPAIWKQFADDLDCDFGEYMYSIHGCFIVKIYVNGVVCGS